MQLRAYQEHDVNQIFSHWMRRRNRVLYQLPTGGGKTPVAVALGLNFYNRGLPVIFFAHRDELISQCAEAVQRVIGEKPGIIKSGVRRKRSLFQVASVQSFCRLEYSKRPPAALLIFDEGHRVKSETYLDILNSYPKSYVLYLTATPRRTDGQGFDDVADELVTGKTARWLIENGYLSKYRLYAAFNSSADISGDYLKSWFQHARGKQTVFFAKTVERSKAIAELFNAHGIRAEHLDGYADLDDRRDILKRFRDKRTTVLCNRDIVSEGLDIPEIEAVQFERRTDSYIFWLQAIGRGMRPGKDFLRIIDHTTNWKNLPFPGDDIEWSLDGNVKVNSKLADSLFLEDRSEENYYDEADTEDNDWDEQPKREKKPKQNVNAELEELTVELRTEFQDYIDNLIKIQQQQKKIKPWVLYRVLENPRIRELSFGEWKYLAKKLGMTDRWSYQIWKEVQNSVLTVSKMKQLGETLKQYA